MKSLVRSAATLLYPRGSVRKVWRGTRRGCRFIVRDAMGVMFALGKPDEDTVKLYRSLVKPGDTVFDVGANRGQMVLVFSKLVGPTGLVVAFEPVPDLARDLQRNCELNDIKNVKVISAAAAGQNGEQVFSFPADRQTQGKLASVEPTYDNQASESFRVRTVSLDSVVEEIGRTPSFMKIDVEGAAGAVLAGASELLRSAGRPGIYLELHGPEERVAAGQLAIVYKYGLTDMNGRAIQDPVVEYGNPLICIPLK